MRKHTQSVRRFNTVRALWCLFLVPLFMSLATLFAPTQAASIAQGYPSVDADLVVGMAAALNTDGEGRSVVRASVSNPYKFVGIVTTKDANFLTLTSAKANVVVATSGEVSAFVSNTNGVIKNGDSVTISPIKGVLMRAGAGDTQVFATALEDFAEAKAVKQDIGAFDGSGRDVYVGTMRVELNPRSIAEGQSDANETFLQTLGQNITGKALKEWQVLTSLVIFILLLVVEAALIYGAIHSTITALGRNPLSREAVYKQLMQVVFMVLALFAFGLAVIYAILQI